MTFADHFSSQARTYAASRPTYPDALYAWIAAASPGHARAWDCATGNGQAARGLARHFREVVATDGSAAQLQAAEPVPGVVFRTATAEDSGLPDASVDTVTVAQALHWFDHARFWAEVRRVVRPGGLVACWGYHRHTVDPAVDAVTEDFFEVVEPYWPEGRMLLQRDYRDIPFPFARLPAPDVALTLPWRAADMAAYLRSWSATQRCRDDRGVDPVDAVEPRLREAWGDGVREVTWATCWLAGRRSG